MRTLLLLAIVAFFLALVEVRGQEVRDEEKLGKAGRYSKQDWDYYEEEVESSNDSRKRREAFGEDVSRQSGSLDGANQENPRLKRNPKKSAIRINQEMSELNTKNNTEPLLVEDPPGIGLGHILGNNIPANQ